MFTDEIFQESLLVTSNRLDDRFAHVSAPIFRSDATMMATVRFLIAPRTDNVVMISTHWPFNDGSPIIGDLKRETDHMIFIRVPDLTGADLLTAAGEGWREVPDLGRFLSSVAPTRVIQNETTRCTAVVYGSRPTMAAWHLAQAVISRLMPWYFKDHPLTASESEYVRSLAGRNSGDYIRAAEALCSELGFESEIIRASVRSFAEGAIQGRIDNLKEQLDTLRDRQADLMERYSRTCEEVDNLNMMLTGAMEAAKEHTSDEDELSDLFIRSKNLIIDGMSSSGSIRFVAKGYLTSVDSDQYEIMADRPASFLYDPMTGIHQVFQSNENRKLLLDALFSSNATCRLKVCSAYSLSMHGVSGIEHYDYPASCADYVRNQHIDAYACLGAYYELIMDRINAGDLVGAVLQCQASAQSQNVGESATMTRLLRELFSCDRKCIELPDGRSVTPVEALENL